MNHDNTIQSNWRTVASCLASQNYISIVKGLVIISQPSMTRKYLIKSMKSL